MGGNSESQKRAWDKRKKRFTQEEISEQSKKAGLANVRSANYKPISDAARAKSLETRRRNKEIRDAANEGRVYVVGQGTPSIYL
jgi:hypothetical protein